MSALIALAARVAAAPVTTRDLDACDGEDAAAPGDDSEYGACRPTAEDDDLDPTEMPDPIPEILPAESPSLGPSESAPDDPPPGDPAPSDPVPGDPSDPDDPRGALDEADLAAIETELLERHGLGPASTIGLADALDPVGFRARDLRRSHGSRLDLALTWRRNLDDRATGPAQHSDEVWLVATWRR